MAMKILKMAVLLYISKKTYKAIQAYLKYNPNLFYTPIEVLKI